MFNFCSDKRKIVNMSENNSLKKIILSVLSTDSESWRVRIVFVLFLLISIYLEDNKRR